MKNTSWKISVLMIGIVVMALISACSKGKQQAAAGISTAKMNISRAKAAQADRWSPTTLANAESKLKTAEQNYTKGNYGYAKTQALSANEYALQAQEEIKAKQVKAEANKKAFPGEAKAKMTKTEAIKKVSPKKIDKKPAKIKKAPKI